MIYRWLTSRSRDDDVPASPQSRGGLERLLEEQYPQSPREELFNGRTRPDTYTWHNGPHRGVVWMNKSREFLWLLCFADGHHDAGYDLGHALARDDRLYPSLDPDFSDGEAAAEWGEFADEDMLEWIRLVEGAEEVFQAARAGAGELHEHGAPVAHIRLARDDGLLTLTIRRQLLYASSDRDRYLSDEEMLDLVRQLVGDPEEDLIEPHVPPHLHGFVNFHAAADLLSARGWLQARMDEMTSGKSRRGKAPTKV